MSDLLLLGAYGDSGPHPRQYPPGLQLPKAGFNVGSAFSGGRWDSEVAMAREPEAATAAQGQLQRRICCYWGQMGILRLPLAAMDNISALGRQAQSGCHGSRT